MGWMDWFRGRVSEPVANPQVTLIATASRSMALSGEDRWYVPVDGNRERFVEPDGGMPLLHLIRYYSGGEPVLRLCEDSTGLLVGPTDRRLAPAGIYVSNLRGESYHKTACRRGDFSPGSAVRLKREPDNAHDPFAVAVTADTDGAPVAAYVNKAKARTLAKLLDQGVALAAVSLRGTSSNTACEQIGVLVARPDVSRRVLHDDGQRNSRLRVARRPAAVHHTRNRWLDTNGRATLQRGDGPIPSTRSRAGGKPHPIRLPVRSDQHAGCGRKLLE